MLAITRKSSGFEGPEAGNVPDGTSMPSEQSAENRFT